MPRAILREMRAFIPTGRTGIVKKCDLFLPMGKTGGGDSLGIKTRPAQERGEAAIKSVKSVFIEKTSRAKPYELRKKPPYLGLGQRGQHGVAAFCPFHRAAVARTTGFAAHGSCLAGLDITSGQCRRRGPIASVRRFLVVAA